MKIQLVEKPTVDIRGDLAVVIFPSRPYWFSATKEIIMVLDALQLETDDNTAIKNISRNLNVSLKEASETFEEIYNLLCDNNVLVVNGVTTDGKKLIEPSFQINTVENVLVIAATQQCNLECLHCYANAKRPLCNEMTTDNLKQLIDDLSLMPWKNEVSRVGLTGGEFFTRCDAMDIIDYVHAKGFKVLVSSNGLLLTNEIIKKLAEYKNFKISISLDGPTARIHELIRGEETFKRTIKAIKEMTSQGIFVGVNMFIHQNNIDFIEETLQLVNELGVKAFNCLNLMRVGRANSQRSKAELTRVPEYILNRRLFEILRSNQQYQELMKNSTFANQIMGIAGGIKSHYCGIGTNRALYVKADGNIYPCPDTAIPKFCLGNIRDKKLWDIWEQSPLLQELRELNVDTMNQSCAKCDVRYFCGGGCRGENYQVTKNIKSSHFNCIEIRKMIFDMMWMLTEEPNFFQDKVENLYKTVCF